MSRSKVVIPSDLKCPECGSTSLAGAGLRWHLNPSGDNPPRVKIRQYRCRNCGKIFINDQLS